MCTCTYCNVTSLSLKGVYAATLLHSNDGTGTYPVRKLELESGVRAGNSKFNALSSLLEAGRLELVDAALRGRTTEQCRSNEHR